MRNNLEPIDIRREKVPCALCGSDDIALRFEVTGHARSGVYLNGVFRQVAGRERIVRCQECGLVYVNPRLAPTPGITTYSVQEELAYFDATRTDRQIGNEDLLQRIVGFLSGPGRLLDVGCGDGLLLAQAQRRGWDAWGLEVSGELVARVRAEHGLTQLFHGTLDAAAYPSAHFDAVILINVIEHLRQPSETVQEIARVTRPGGVVAVHTPNVDSLAARYRGPAWHHYEPFEHFYYFNAYTLQRLLEKSGLRVSGSFALYSSATAKRWLLTVIHRLGLRLDNGLGLLARRVP